MEQEIIQEEIIQEEVAETLPLEMNVEEVHPEPVAVPEKAPKDVKKLFKKWWFWAFVAVLLLALILGVSSCSDSGSGSSSGSSGSSSSSSSTYVPSVSPFVTLVKGARNSNYGITYGAAFDSFFTRPRWSYFQASSGEHVVEFEGGFSFDGSPATATIQFVLDLQNDTLEVYHLSINGQAQSRAMLAAMIQKVFESY